MLASVTSPSSAANSCLNFSTVHGLGPHRKPLPPRIPLSGAFPLERRLLVSHPGARLGSLRTAQ